MTGSCKGISLLLKDGIGIVTRLVLGMTIGPWLIYLYALCWIRVKLTALVYCNNRTSLFLSEDVLPVMNVNHVDSIINVIILTRENFSLDDMKGLFISKVLNAKDTSNRPRFPKFTRYVRLCAGYLMWTEDSNFNIDDHIRLYRGQPPNDEEHLKMLITDLCHKTFSFLKSGWEVTVIPLAYSQSDDPQTCILFRVHHFITDGISILRLVIEQMAGNHGAYQHILERMQNKFKPKFKNPFLNILASLIRVIYNYIFKPSGLPVDRVNQVFMKDQSIDCELSNSGYIDWSSAIKMDEIRRIRDATSTSVNDVLISCMAGAFKKYFVTHDISPPDSLKTFIPINYQGPDDPVEMINKVHGLFMLMPIGEMDCLQRLKATTVAMDQLKCSPDNITNRWLKRYFFHIIPYNIISRIEAYFHVNVAFSNMPGPTSKAAFNGNTIESLFTTVLPFRRLGFSMNVVTYAGDVIVSAAVDKARVSSREDLRQLLDDFVVEFQKLSKSVACSSSKQSSTAMEKKID